MPKIPVIKINNTNYEIEDAVMRKKIRPLYIINKGDNTRLFTISSVEDPNRSNYYFYTITSLRNVILRAVSETEVGNDYGMYTISYEEGSNNIGTSEWSYKYDTTITNQTSIPDFAAFVVDRSDYTLKIISARYLNDNQRVIALFYGNNMAVKNSFTGFGDNETLFMTSHRSVNKINIINSPDDARDSMTWSWNNGIYTVTRVKDNFICYGIAEPYCTQVNIGSSGNPYVGADGYPIPQSFSSTHAIGTYAAIVIDLDDHTENTWKIISIDDVSNTLNRFAVLGYIYSNERFMFFNEYTEYLFTNCTEDVGSWKTSITPYPFWWTYNTNTCIPVQGKILYNTENNTVTLQNLIIAPTPNPGGFKQINNTQVVDFSLDEHPGYLKCIYFNNVNNTFIGVSSETPEEVRLYIRKHKNSHSLLCMVYGSRGFVYTSGYNKPGMWYFNGRDIYLQDSDSSGIGKDLFKAFKKVGVIGDSLSVGYMYNKSTSTATSRMLQYSWPKQLMKDAGEPWLNLGTSGQSVLTWCSNETYGKVQAEASGNKCQAYIIGLGENDCSDSSRGVPLGSSSDIDPDYTHVATTYYGGYVRIIEILKHLNPTCKIFCLTNPRSGTAREQYNAAVKYITNTYYANDNNVILIDMAVDYSDLFNGGVFLPVDSASITGGHYSAAGYARIASIMEKAISLAIEENVESMYDIAYIPYDTSTPTANTMTE